jgi:hypothetical protein
MIKGQEDGTYLPYISGQLGCLIKAEPEERANILMQIRGICFQALTDIQHIAERLDALYEDANFDPNIVRAQAMLRGDLRYALKCANQCEWYLEGLNREYI